jgi:glucose/arabinose dehydrogenase
MTTTSRPFVFVMAATVAAWALSVPTASAQMLAQVYASGFSAPIAFVQDPSDPTVQYVAEQGGVIRVIKNGAVQSTPFLNLATAVGLASGGEQGLLGLAFPPNYGTNGRFYVKFTKATNQAVVARFKRSGNPLVADPASYFPFVWSADPDPGEVDSVPLSYIPQPQTNHNGGCLQFGPDGYLYISTGDGGGGNDLDHNAQNITELLGKMLRVDVNVSDTHPNGFVVPPGNAGLPRPEIWSLGLRNPWRFSFDDPSKGGTGAMLIGDVGQGAREEIDYESPARPGRNYGWRNYEGTRLNVNDRPLGTTPAIFPMFEYDHTVGQSVTGGYVYRGSAMPAFRGRYFFADYVAGRVWSLAFTVNGAGEATAISVSEHTAALGSGVIGHISAFGVDSAGELYIVNHTGGTIVKMVVPPTPPAPLGLKVVR